MSDRGNIDYYDLANQIGLRGSVSASGQMYAQCPFHHDRSPSFSLNVRTGLWFCHREQRGGTFDEVVAHVRGISRTEAMIWIVANGRPPDPASVGEVTLSQERVDRQQAYYNRLSREAMCQWWFQRGLGWDDADYWGVRYDGRANEVIYPVWFPHSTAGQWVGYIRRTFGGVAKYINSPGIPRRNILYGYGCERAAKSVILCEGPMDAIKARNAGYYAVATLGVYVSDEQLRLFRRIPAQRYILAMDGGDAAGLEATSNIIERWSRVTGGLLIFNYPEGVKDVGDCTPDQVRDGVENAIPAAIYAANRR